MGHHSSAECSCEQCPAFPLSGELPLLERRGLAGRLCCAYSGDSYGQQLKDKGEQKANLLVSAWARLCGAAMLQSSLWGEAEASLQLRPHPCSVLLLGAFPQYITFIRVFVSGLFLRAPSKIPSYWACPLMTPSPIPLRTGSPYIEALRSDLLGLLQKSVIRIYLELIQFCSYFRRGITPFPLSPVVWIEPNPIPHSCVFVCVCPSSENLHTSFFWPHWLVHEWAFDPNSANESQVWKFCWNYWEREAFPLGLPSG